MRHIANYCRQSAQIMAFCVLSSIISSSALSQWQSTGFSVPNVFPVGGASQSQTIKFKDGILWLGYQDKVCISNDTGKTWRVIVNPGGYPTGTINVTDIGILDSNQVIVSYFLKGGIITYDQGRTWKNLPPSFVAGANSVAYLDIQDSIIAAHSRGIAISVDNGNTASLVFYDSGRNYQNYIQVKYSSQENIFVLKNDIDTLGFIAYSTNEGISWTKTSPFGHDTYGFDTDPCNDSILYVANEDIYFSFTILSQLLVSYNRGSTWDTTYQNKARPVSGHIQATPKAVYATTTKDGVLRSLDKGKTWRSIGGPLLGYETKLMCAVNDNIVFVVDTNGAVWVTYNSGGDRIQQGDEPNLTTPIFAKTSSCSTRTVPITIGATGCGVMTIDSISISGQDAQHFTISTPTFPSFLTEGTSYSWGVQFSPLDQVGVFTATLRIKGHYKLYDDSLGIDTLISISAESLAEPPRLTSLATTYNLGTASTCNQARDTVITLHNTGCDTLCITQGPGAIPSEFIISALSYPYCIPPDSSVTINVRFTPLGTGTSRAYPKYRAEQQGLTQDVELFLEGTGVEGDGIFAYEPKSFDFNALSFCSRDSGSGYVTNTGCDTLSLTDATLFADADYTMSGLPPLALIPNDTIRYQVYLNPQMKGVRRGYIVLSTTNRNGLRRDSIPLTVNVTDGTRILSSSPNTLDFGTTTLCEERDSVVTLRNTGCDTLRILGFGVQGIGFSSSVATPIIIPPGGSIDIPVNTIVDTSQGNISTGTITFTSDADNQIAPITLSRSYTYPKSYSFHIGMLDGSATSDEIVRLAIVGEQGLGSAGSGVNRLDFDLSLNEDLLEYIRPEGSNTVSKNGSRITISNPNELASTDDTLAILVYHVFLTKDSATDITVSNISINNGDTSSCALKIAAITQAGFTYRYECGDKHIQSFLRTGQASLEITSIRPNPTNGDATVSFESFTNDKAQLQLLDELGKVVLEETLSTKRGANDHTIAIPKHWSGTFFVRLQMGKDVVTGKFVKQ